MEKDKPPFYKRNLRIALIRSCKMQFWVLFLLVISGLTFYYSFTSYRHGQSAAPPTPVKKTIEARYSNDDFLRFHTGPRYLTPDNHNLIRYISNRFGGPSRQPNYNLTNMNGTDYSHVGQSRYVDWLLGGRTNGFYVECGARDGETASKSLFFERQRGWKGLLIEANPFSYRKLLFKRRQAYSINACLSPDNQARIMRFRPAGISGSLEGRSNKDRHEALKKHPEYQGFDESVQCYPFSSIMMAASTTFIDYFALSLHGLEEEILRTIPFDKIEIDVISVEFRVAELDNPSKTDSLQTAANLHLIRRFFESTGLYTEVGILPGGTKIEQERHGLDVFFRRNVNLTTASPENTNANQS